MTTTYRVESNKRATAKFNLVGLSFNNDVFFILVGFHRVVYVCQCRLNLDFSAIVFYAGSITWEFNHMSSELFLMSNSILFACLFGCF